MQDNFEFDKISKKCIVKNLFKTKFFCIQKGFFKEMVQTLSLQKLIFIVKYELNPREFNLYSKYINYNII